MKQPARLKSLWNSCEHLPPEKLVMLSQLASQGVSDQALVAALAVVQMLKFDRYDQLLFKSVSEVTGQPTKDVRQAIDELLAVGALELQVVQCEIVHVVRYRLAMLCSTNAQCAKE